MEKETFSVSKAMAEAQNNLDQNYAVIKDNQRASVPFYDWGGKYYVSRELRRSEIRKAQDRNDRFFYAVSTALFLLWAVLVLSALARLF